MIALRARPRGRLGDDDIALAARARRLSAPLLRRSFRTGASSSSARATSIEARADRPSLSLVPSQLKREPSVRAAMPRRHATDDCGTTRDAGSGCCPISQRPCVTDADKKQSVQHPTEARARAAQSPTTSFTPTGAGGNHEFPVRAVITFLSSRQRVHSFHFLAPTLRSVRLPAMAAAPRLRAAGGWVGKARADVLLAIPAARRMDRRADVSPAPAGAQSRQHQRQQPRPHPRSR